MSDKDSRTVAERIADETLKTMIKRGIPSGPIAYWAARKHLSDAINQELAPLILQHQGMSACVLSCCDADKLPEYGLADCHRGPRYGSGGEYVVDPDILKSAEAYNENNKDKQGSKDE